MAINMLCLSQKLTFAIPLAEKECVTYMKCRTLSSNVLTMSGNSAMWKLPCLDGHFCTETAYGSRELGRCLQSHFLLET